MSERGQCSQLLLACPRFVRGFFCPFAGEIQDPAGFWRGARGSFSPFLAEIALNRFDCKTILMVFVSFKNYSHTVLERAQGPVQLARTKGQRVCPPQGLDRGCSAGDSEGTFPAHPGRYQVLAERGPRLRPLTLGADRQHQSGLPVLLVTVGFHFNSMKAASLLWTKSEFDPAVAGLGVCKEPRLGWGETALTSEVS